MSITRVEKDAPDRASHPNVMSQESLDIPTEWWLDWCGFPDRLT
jgi:hypothetical protein